MFQNLPAQAQYIKSNFADVKIIEPIANGNLIIYIDKNNLENLLTFLRDDEQLSFKTLIDVFGADMLGIRSPRFEVIYNLLSYKLNNRITIKVAIDDGIEVPTVSRIFSSAGWFEREAFDLFGIVFEGHPDLRRILTDYGFIGHPFRKDFPISGNVEMRYDPELKRVVYQPVTIEAREITPRIVREEQYGGPV
jgi:NADH-quinone oxidoreductase subunit C